MTELHEYCRMCGGSCCANPWLSESEYAVLQHFIGNDAIEAGHPVEGERRLDVPGGQVPRCIKRRVCIIISHAPTCVPDLPVCICRDTEQNPEVRNYPAS